MKTAPDIRRSVTQINTFYDSKTGDLRRGGWALRIRKENDRYIITVKGKSTKKNNGVFVRQEFEETMPGDTACSLEHGFRLGPETPLPARKLYTRIGDIRVAPFIKFTNSRTFISALGYILELDRTEILDRIFYELELEVPLEEIPTAQKKLMIWFDKSGWEYIPSRISKLEKALILMSEKKTANRYPTDSNSVPQS